MPETFSTAGTEADAKLAVELSRLDGCLMALPVYNLPQTAE
jgi:hypothetical protein